MHAHARYAAPCMHMLAHLPLCMQCSAEYAEGSTIFLAKIDRLGSLGYSYMRRTRGDGNCFYRAFVFGYLERLLLRTDKAECER